MRGSDHAEYKIEIKLERVNSLQEMYWKCKCEYENNFEWYFRSYNQVFWNVFREVPI